MYTQKHGRSIYEFDFKSNGIQYQTRDGRITRSELIPFESVTNIMYELFETDKYLIYNSITFALAGVFGLVLDLLSGSVSGGVVFLVASIVFLFMYNKSRQQFTMVHLEGRLPMNVLNDSQKDEIIANIYKLRNGYLMSKYGHVNYNNSRESEISRFMWLNRLGVINERELEVIKDVVMDE